MSTAHRHKRRRERDRPKHHPGAAYDPNERVTLSYESDEETTHIKEDIEIETQATAAPFPLSEAVSATPAPTRNQVDYSQEYVKGQDSEQQYDDRAREDSGSWRKKRKNHHRNPHYSDQHYKSHDDTGQWPALGGGTGEGDDGTESDATQDEAMAYLNSVRLERESLPTTVTASRFEDLYAAYEDESTAAFADGVYAARPNFGPSLPPEYKRTITAMEAYTRSLLSRFDKMHEALQQVVDDSSKVEAYEYWPGDDEEDKAWLWHITQEMPNHAQLSKMHPDMALDLLDLIGRTLFKVSEIITSSLGAWILSFFARLDSYGQLHMEKISRLREFAQAAERILAEVHSNARKSESEQPMKGVEEIQRDVEVRATAESHAQDRVVLESDRSEVLTDDTSSKDQSDLVAILDMVLTIVGERFGQRDLLELRQWPTE